MKTHLFSDQTLSLDATQSRHRTYRDFQGPVDGHCGHCNRNPLVAAQAGDEGLGHPMPERRLAAEPLALRAAAAQTGHFGCRSGLVEKDQPIRLKPHSRLACGGPFLARRFDVGTILLARQQSFFLKR
jgi:hypothetical protein